MGGSEGHTVHRHHHHHLMDDGNGGDVEGLEQPLSSGSWGVSCSICLDLVSHNGGRSRAKLQCGHEFHLGMLVFVCFFSFFFFSLPLFLINYIAVVSMKNHNSFW